MANIKRIEAALASYAGRGSAARDGRLEFFEGIWTIQARHAEAAAGSSGYRLPSAAEVSECVAHGECVTHRAPIPVSADALGRAAAEIGAYCLEAGGFVDEQARTLEQAAWEALAQRLPVDAAGANPEAFLESAAAAAEKDGLEDAGLVATVFSLALRPLLESDAARIAGLMKAGLALSANAEGRPLRCPVCGCAPAASYVGRIPGNDGNGKLLWCAQCGADWEFERVRCPHCGTREQKKLHYLSIEGDDAHRAYCCDECGGYVRTTFVGEGSLAPFSFDVENAAMVDLDAMMRARVRDA